MERWCKFDVDRLSRSFLGFTLHVRPGTILSTTFLSPCPNPVRVRAPTGTWAEVEAAIVLIIEEKVVGL